MGSSFREAEQRMCKDALLLKLAANAHADPTSRERFIARVVTFVLEDAHTHPRGAFWARHIQTNAANFVRYLLAEDGRRLRECLTGGDITDRLTDMLFHFYPVALIEAMRADHDRALAKEELAQFVKRFVLSPGRHGVRSDALPLQELAGGFASHMVDGESPRVLQYRGDSLRAFLRTCLKRFMLDRIDEETPPAGVQIVAQAGTDPDEPSDLSASQEEAAPQEESVLRRGLVADLAARVHRVLTKMEARDALVLTLSVVGELSYQEIAERSREWGLGPIAEGNARVIRHRAGKRFAALMAQELGGEEALRDVAPELGRWIEPGYHRPRKGPG